MPLSSVISNIVASSVVPTSITPPIYVVIPPMSLSDVLKTVQALTSLITVMPRRRNAIYDDALNPGST